MDKTWKKFERRVCQWFGGKRRGADYRGYAHGKNDCLSPGFSVECKLLSRPSFQDILDACVQAEKAKETPNDIPVAVVKRKGDRDTETLFVIRKEEFLQWFVPTSQSK